MQRTPTAFTLLTRSRISKIRTSFGDHPMKQTKQFLIYGATGFTGKLTARTAKENGLEPILGGRNEAKLKAIAEPLGLQFRAFDLSEQKKVDAALGEVDAVLHIAGPFSATSKPMVDACLRTGVAVGRHVIDTQRHQIAAAQLAVDGEVEQVQVSRATLQLQLRPDGPDVAGPQRRLGAGELALVARLRRGLGRRR